MSLEAILLTVTVILLSLITLILVGAVIAVFTIRKKIKHLPIGKFGGAMSILPIAKYLLSRRRRLHR